jgi:hypothetical protein
LFEVAFFGFQTDVAKYGGVLRNFSFFLLDEALVDYFVWICVLLLSW